MLVTKTVIFVCNKISHIVLKCRWCDRPTFLNAHATNKNKNDDLNGKLRFVRRFEGENRDRTEESEFTDKTFNLLATDFFFKF